MIQLLINTDMREKPRPHLHRQVIKRGIYLIVKANSIFTTRNGKKDISVMVPGSWGSKESDGKKYHTAFKMTEDGEVLRSYKKIPFTIEQLKNLQF